MKNFFKQNYHKHLLGGMILVTPFIWLLIKYDPSFDIGKIGQCIVAGMTGLGIGFIWEWYNGKYHESAFDWNDIFFTVLGAIIGTLLL